MHQISTGPPNPAERIPRIHIAWDCPQWTAAYLYGLKIRPTQLKNPSRPLPLFTTLAMRRGSPGSVYKNFPRKNNSYHDAIKNYIPGGALGTEKEKGSSGKGNTVDRIPRGRLLLLIFPGDHPTTTPHHPQII